MRLASVAVLFFLFLAFAHAQNESIDVNESIKLVLQNDSMAFDVFFLNGTLSNETLVSNSTFLNGTLVDLNETVLDETATDVLTSVNESVSEINATLSNETFVDNSTFSNETITDVEESIVGNSSFSNEAFDLNESVVGNFSFSNESAVVPPFNETVQYFNGTDLNETVVDIPSLNETSYIENITLPFVNVTLPELNGAVPGNSSDVVGQFMNLSVGFGEEFVFVVEQMNESMNESAGFSAGGNVSGGFSENISSVVGNISAGHAVNDTLRLLEAEAFTQALSEGKLTNNLFNNLTGMSDEDEIRVMVYLKDDEVVKALSRNEFSAKSAKKQDEIMAEKTKAIRSKQDKVLSKISDDKFKPKHKFNLINGFSGMVKREGITALLEDPDVEKIEEVATVKLHLAQSVPMINTTRAWNLQFGGINITGAGQAVCVIDSGVNYSHPSMGGCSRSDFTSGNCDKVPWGHDYYNELGQQDNDPLDEDDYHGGHGTNVAGIIASEHTTYRGVAPDAKIIAMKVFDSSGGGGYTDDIAAAILACTINRSLYNISVITMSLGTSTYHTCTPSNCDSGWSGLASAMQTAYNAGIFIDASSGNEAQTTGISFPACNSYAVSVGAVYDYSGTYSSGTCSESTSLDQVTCFSNRCSILDVWAPGSKITAPSYLGANWFVTMSGTSQAAPHVAGAAALIQQYAKLLNGSILPPARVKAALVATGKSITRDVTKPRIDVFKAVRYFNFQAPRATAGVYPSDGNPSTLFNFTLNYTDLDNSAPSYVRVNIDGINYTMKQASSSVDYYNRVTYYFNTTLSGGTHSYNFSASDGGYINRTTTQTLQVSTSPTLSNPQVTPASGITSTVFNYTVVYTDEDNGTPTYVYAVVDGTNHNMSGNSTDYDAGVLYHYATTLSAGTHNYFFNASDGTYRNQTALVSGSPTVNAEPSLSNPQVNPTVGPTNTLFNYTVVYTDAGNEAPTQKNLILDGTTYSMQGTGTTYSAGVTYYYNKTLSAGTHNYRFSFSDGLYTVLTTTTSNPKVYSTTPSCDGAPTNQPNWIVNTYTNCTSTAVLPTSTLRGYLNITGGYTLNLTNTKIYLNNTRLYLDGKLILKDSEFDFII